MIELEVDADENDPLTVEHIADTHLGYTQYNSPEREQDFLDAYNQTIDDAIENDVDVVVHGGDIFHNSRVDTDVVFGFVAGALRLEEHGIPLLMVVGNHEGTNGKQWADIFEKLNLAYRLSDEPVLVGDTAFYGLDYVPKSRRSELDYQFKPSDAEYNILVSHGQFAPLTAGQWDAEDVLAKSNISFDGMLLGDEHERKITELGDTLVTYPGSTERTQASQTSVRGYNLLEIGIDPSDEEFNAPIRAKRIPIDTRRFVYLDVELSGDQGTARVREELNQYNIEDAIVIVNVLGDGTTVKPAPVEKHGVEEGGALRVRVNDRREQEYDDEEEIEIDFADPESEARDRIRDMDLTAASEELEHLVRDEEVPESKLADRVEERVDELVEEDPEAFNPVDDDTDDDGTDNTDSSSDSTDAPQSDAGQSASESDAGETSTDHESESHDSDTPDSGHSSTPSNEQGKQVELGDL